MISIPPKQVSVSVTRELFPFEVHYWDEHWDRYIYCCYAYDEDHARSQAVEMVQHIHDDVTRLKRIDRLRHEDFDW